MRLRILDEADAPAVPSGRGRRTVRAGQWGGAVRRGPFGTGRSPKGENSIEGQYGACETVAIECSVIEEGGKGVEQLGEACRSGFRTARC